MYTCSKVLLAWVDVPPGTSSTTSRWIKWFQDRLYHTNLRKGNIEFFEKNYTKRVYCWYLKLSINDHEFDADNFISESGPKLGFFFLKGGMRVTLCHTQVAYQIGMSTSTLCFAKSGIFWMKIECREGQAYLPDLLHIDFSD